MKIAVNYNSINNLDFFSLPVFKRLPQNCFGSQTKSVQTQIDMITNEQLNASLNF